MRELLIAFVIALVVGSIINGWPKEKPTQAGQSQAGQTSQIGQPGQSQSSLPNSSSTPSVATNPGYGENRDFPDFASFVSLDNGNFDNQVLKSEKPVFIDCYVPNNSACDQMQPLVAATAKTHGESVTMAKLNVMDNLVLAHRYGVGTVPTFLLFNKGELVSKLNGILSQASLESMIATMQQSASSQPSNSSSIQ